MLEPDAERSTAVKVVAEKLFAATERYDGDPAAFRAWLAGELGCSERTLKRALPKYVAAGYLREIRVGDRKRCKRYTLTEAAKESLANAPKLGRSHRLFLAGSKRNAPRRRSPTDDEVLAEFAADPEYRQFIIDLARHLYIIGLPPNNTALSSGDKQTRITALFEADCLRFMQNCTATRYHPQYHSFHAEQLERFRDVYGPEATMKLIRSETYERLRPAVALPPPSAPPVPA